MGGAGIEPALFLMCLIYSQVRSPLRYPSKNLPGLVTTLNSFPLGGKGGYYK